MHKDRVGTWELSCLTTGHVPTWSASGRRVVNAFAAIAAADTGRFQLVFGGGTALSRAYGLIRRMSEDIDLRIVAADAPTGSILPDRGGRSVMGVPTAIN